jgi:hypothetical protein
MGQTGQADELLEVLGDELGTVVGDDSGLGSGALSQGALDDAIHVGLGHGLAQFVVDDGAGAAVEQGAEVVEGLDHVDVGDVHMPVLV